MLMQEVIVIDSRFYDQLVEDVSNRILSFVHQKIEEDRGTRIWVSPKEAMEILGIRS